MRETDAFVELTEDFFGRDDAELVDEFFDDDGRLRGERTGSGGAFEESVQRVRGQRRRRVVFDELGDAFASFGDLAEFGARRDARV